MSQNTLTHTNIKTRAENDKRKAKRQGPKRPKKITESYLHNSGLYYLERFASSSKNFEDVMMRKVKKSCAHHKDQDFEACKEMVQKLVQKFQNLELLNDDVYTRNRVRSLRLKGKSTRYIIGNLRSKGISTDLTNKHLHEFENEHGYQDGEAELEAALTFARKKRIGPYRTSEKDNTEKELAKLARAGFSYDTARAVLNKNTDDF